MNVQVRDRVRRACGELIQKHLDLLLLLLAERGLSAEEQHQKTNTLVRCLNHIKYEETLFIQGRRVPMRLDREPGKVPVLTLNEEFLSRVDDQELLATFTRPVCELLELAPINVGLVLQGQDEKQLRNLYHSARARVRGEVIRAASVRAVIERRVTIFTGRLRALLNTLSRGMNIPLPSPLGFIQWLSSCKGNWPEWIDVAGQDFIVQVRSSMEMVLGSNLRDGIPAEVLIELCWESLELSPQSFLRQAARDLRSRELPVDEHFLRLLGEVVASDDMEALERIEAWPSLADLQDAWSKLYHHEVEGLQAYHHLSPTVPSISPLQAPRDSLLLREPEDLPWSCPLVCWSVRETNALRDLLNGFVQAHRVHEQRDDSEVEVLLVEELDASLDTSLVLEGNHHVRTQVVATTIETPEGFEKMTERALRATLARIKRQVESLPEAQRLGVCHRLRGCYDGFFMNTSQIWQRRLQGWKLDPLDVALERLCLAVSDLFELPVLFDPFMSPDDSTLKPVPTFCFVVAMSEHLERIPFYIPISALMQTSATGTPPICLRFLDVPNSPQQPCRWLADEELTMDTMQGQPVSTTLAAIEQSRLRMLAYR